MIGETLLHYRITDRLGAGGMGEVYRATDAKLGRDVAIKVLPPDVSGDAQRLARFRREARALAALSHAGIAAIHGFEDAGDQPFLVLELVEGETLAARLERGPLPTEDAVDVAAQIAAALEEAHAHGIVHRDLKPANVMLTPQGRVKVLDFGLARAWAGDADASSGDLSASPTADWSGTVAGVILGTAAYMSPEQASGKPVDRRSDLWSFGVVLFEMLTGRRLFAGETVGEVLAAVIKDEPEWRRLPPDLHPAVERLLRRCLQKRPRQRLRDAGDALLELESAGGGDEAHLESAATDRRGRQRERWLWAAALVFVALGALVVDRAPPSDSDTASPIRLRMAVPPGLSAEGFRALALSADGRQLAMVDGQGPLWVRSLAEPEPRSLPGTEGALLPFWSPDGLSIAYSTRDEAGIALQRIEVETGYTRTICRLPAPAEPIQGTWSRDDLILFASLVAQGRHPIYAVPAEGGEPRLLMDPDPASEMRMLPRFLPDGRRFVFSTIGPGQPGLWMSSIDRVDERSLLHAGQLGDQYVAPGYLTQLRDGTLFAQRFDAEAGRPLGDPVTLAASVASHPRASTLPAASVSENGVLVYWSGGGGARLAWLDRRGTVLGTVGEPDYYVELQLSPDEKRVATAVRPPRVDTSRELWVLDLERGVADQVGATGMGESAAAWSPDGSVLFFSGEADSAPHWRLHRVALDAGAPAPLQAETAHDAWPTGVTPDGRTLVFATGADLRNDEIRTLPSGGGPSELLLQGDHQFADAQVSPDGRWLAFDSNESGDWEVYVAPFRRPGPKLRVSPQGGRQPRWASDGGELFYVEPGGALVAVSVASAGERLAVNRPEQLFDVDLDFNGHDTYAVSADGQRFLAIVPEARDGALHVILNWPALLR